MSFRTNMKLDKIGRKLLNKIDDLPQPGVQRVKLTTKPDTVELPKKTKEKPNITQFLRKLFTEKLSGLKKGTIKELEALPLESFLLKAQEIGEQSYGIPATLRAPIVVDDLDKSIGMFYSHPQNAIYVNQKHIGKSRTKLFSYIKHELTHQRQNFDGLRTEGLGEEIVEFYAHANTKMSHEQFKLIYREMPIEKIEELKPQLGENIDIIYGYKKAVAQGPEAEQKFFESIYERDYKYYLEEMENFRQKVIAEMGTLKADSEKGEFAKDCFEVLKTSNDPTAFKTALNPNEIEAYLATAISHYEYLFAKLGLLK